MIHSGLKKAHPTTSEKGEIAVIALKEFCETHTTKDGDPIKFVEGNAESDKVGIDCWVNDIPVDAKHTYCLYFLRVILNSEVIKIRHPFRLNSESKALFIWESGELQYFGLKEDYMLKYFISLEHYKKFLALLASLDDKEICKVFGGRCKTINSFLTVLKDKIKPLLKSRNYVQYYDSIELEIMDKFTNEKIREAACYLVSNEHFKILQERKAKKR